MQKSRCMKYVQMLLILSLLNNKRVASLEIATTLWEFGQHPLIKINPYRAGTELTRFCLFWLQQKETKSANVSGLHMKHNFMYMYLSCDG